ncbi:MAG: GNAT family N-acetyltransferase [Actinomycetota bacterium]|nr:GNAT family N-acetyltransferase [Actinomycetota bacterium]
MTPLTVRPIDPARRADIGKLSALLQRSWGTTVVVSRSTAHDAAGLPGFLAERGDEVVGGLTYRPAGAAWEVVTIDALPAGTGVGTALLDSVVSAATTAGAGRLWLVTTNDNLDALRFYQRRGWRLTLVHPGAVDDARRIKPAILLVGSYGIEIHDELELSFDLRSSWRDA